MSWSLAVTHHWISRIIRSVMQLQTLLHATHIKINSLRAFNSAALKAYAVPLRASVCTVDKDTLIFNILLIVHTSLLGVRVDLLF